MIKFINFILLVLLAIMPADVLITGCQSSEPHTAETIHATLDNTPNIMLITIDGVRWQDVFDEKNGRKILPTIYNRFVDNGMAIGKASPALVGGPAHISMPGYLEIMRGHPSLDCKSNYCNQNTEPTIINQFTDAVVVGGWETIAKTFDNSNAAVNISRRIRNERWNELGITNTDQSQDYFSAPDYRYDTDTIKTAIQVLKHKQPKFMWVSLGDTDEWAHHNRYAMYLEALNKADGFIANVMQIADPNTVYLVCPDHGRSKDFVNHGWEPESANVWIMVAGPSIPKVGFVKYNRDVYLADIMPTILDVTRHTMSDKSLLNFQK